MKRLIESTKAQQSVIGNAGEVINIKVCSPLQQLSGLIGNYYAICHYSYNLPLAIIQGHMNKLVAIVLLSTIFSCTPYQRMFLNSEARMTFLTDSCDIAFATQLNYKLDSVDFPSIEDPNDLLDDIALRSDCEYYQKQLLPPCHLDSTIWFYTIRPYQVGKREVMIGSLYTLFRDDEQASELILERRVKEYSQTEEIEMGKYMVLTYVIEDDSLTSINLGGKEKMKRTTANTK